MLCKIDVFKRLWASGEGECYFMQVRKLFHNKASAANFCTSKKLVAIRACCELVFSVHMLFEN